MTDASPSGAPAAWDEESRGVEWHLELDRSTLLPGQLVGGRVALKANKAIQARGVHVALVAKEHWQRRAMRSGSKGQVRTEVVTEWQELVRQPVIVQGALSLTPGLSWSEQFEVPVPAMGPPSLQGQEAGLDWILEAKLDIDDAFDSRIEAPVVVAQPVAVLRSGSVPVGELALHEVAEVAGDDLSGSITLTPMPLVSGQPFSGRLELRLAKSVKVQELRAELRADVASTVQSGMAGHAVLWSGVLAPAGSYEGTVSFEIAGTVGSDPMPTTVLPHGKCTGSFHVILARSWARDAHLVRDVSLATTGEL